MLCNLIKMNTDTNAAFSILFPTKEEALEGLEKDFLEEINKRANPKKMKNNYFDFLSTSERASMGLEAKDIQGEWYSFSPEYARAEVAGTSKFHGFCWEIREIEEFSIKQNFHGLKRLKVI